ncbi:SDR family NAD(P)-dependent oxidoreductase [Aspergillus stella-maris]|uniref:SDR family NAD(P)-dependent oxidoreductase n=1 Tax=Aspergillus stella-maris TaxID=1810926 RepID=UPI003CCCABA9
MGMLENRTVIITGCSSGIGLATTTRALREGARVLGVDINSPSPSLGSSDNFQFLQCNITDTHAPAKVVQTCVDAYGDRIDSLLNVAGVMDLLGSADNFTDETWDKCIDVNLAAPVRLMREVLPFMRRQRCGTIVNVASKGGLSGAVAGVAYTASKHGLVGASKNVAWRFRDENIRCNVVCPGSVATSMTGDSDPRDLDFDAFQAIKPVVTAHLGPNMDAYSIASEQVAAAIIFLASDSSAGMNGVVLPVDNSWSTI